MYKRSKTKYDLEQEKKRNETIPPIHNCIFKSDVNL